MLEPSLKVLMQQVPSRFMLVNVAAQRARNIADYADEQEMPLQEKAISIAIRELAEGHLRAIVPDSGE